MVDDAGAGVTGACVVAMLNSCTGVDWRHNKRTGKECDGKCVGAMLTVYRARMSARRLIVHRPQSIADAAMPIGYRRYNNAAFSQVAPNGHDGKALSENDAAHGAGGTKRSPT